MNHITPFNGKIFQMEQVMQKLVKDQISQRIESEGINCIESLKLPPVSENYEPISRERLPVLNALIVFDQNRSDENSSMTRRIRDALENEIPVFCPKATLQGYLFNPFLETSDLEITIAIRQINYMLIEKCDKWDLLTDKETGEFIVVIPKSYYGNLRLEEKINVLGLDGNQLIGVDRKEFFEKKSSQIPSIDIFLSLFYRHSSTAFRLFLAGHGNTKSAIAGLNPVDYQKFLDFFDELKTEALFIQSCCAGGINRKYQKDVKFPILLFSIGNFYTYYEKRDYKSFFQKIDTILNEHSNVTANIFRSTIQNNDSWAKYWQNLSQIKLPGAKEFIPLNEDNSSCVITSENDSQEPLQPGEIRLLEIVPERITRSIHLGDSRPIFLSMRCHSKRVHIFSNVESNRNLDSLFETTREIFQDKQAEIASFSQVLFFQTLKCKDEIYSNVILNCTTGNNMTLLAFDRQKEKHLHFSMFALWGAIFSEEISPEAFEEIAKQHIPIEKLQTLSAEIS